MINTGDALTMLLPASPTESLPEHLLQKLRPELSIEIKTGGPGTELKKLLSKIGIKADSGCKCSDRAKHMDYMEQTDPGWCERNIDTIVGWLEEEAKKRKLPFIKTVAKMLVKRAIKNAQRN